MGYYNEADTRAKLIDPKIRLAGWGEGQIEREHYFVKKWLYYYLWSEAGQREILARRSGIAFADKRGQTHIYPKNMLTMPVPLPTVQQGAIEHQRRAIAHLDAVQTEADRMREALDEEERLLDLMERSILERAFRGEL